MSRVGSWIALAVILAVVIWAVYDIGFVMDKNQKDANTLNNKVFGQTIELTASVKQSDGYVGESMQKLTMYVDSVYLDGNNAIMGGMLTISPFKGCHLYGVNGLGINEASVTWSCVDLAGESTLEPEVFTNLRLAESTDAFYTIAPDKVFFP